MANFTAHFYQENTRIPKNFSVDLFFKNSL
jgi:hypothetical protein